MGTCASRPPRKPNPYVRRDASEHSRNHQRPGETNFSTPLPAKQLSMKSGKGVAEEGDEATVALDKRFGLSNKFESMFDVGDEIGRGRFGYTCSAIVKRGELKGRKVAVKIIPKSKLMNAIPIEDVRREVKILQTLTGHHNVAQFYDAFEDADKVYIVTELCEGGGLLDRMLERGGKYPENDPKAIIAQILNAVAFLHLHGVVHGDIKPENFLFTSKDENSQLKAIDFGLSEFVKPDKKLQDIVGSAYYVSPEVLHRSYGTAADVWNVGVITYILLCGGRPFWAQTDSGIFREVLESNPSFDEAPWLSLSQESKDFVTCLLHEDPIRRITASQALCHPWLRKHVKVRVPLDTLVFRLMKAYMQSSQMRKAALRALSKTLTEDELFYMKEQFTLMHPDERGGITLETIKLALTENSPSAAESHIMDLVAPLNALQYRRMHFQEFCAAALCVHQLDVLNSWEDRTHRAYEIFEQKGNKVIAIQELASELRLCPSMTVHTVLQEWVRPSDGKLTLTGFVELLHGQSTKNCLKT